MLNRLVIGAIAGLACVSGVVYFTTLPESQSNSTAGLPAQSQSAPALAPAPTPASAPAPAREVAVVEPKVKPMAFYRLHAPQGNNDNDFCLEFTKELVNADNIKYADYLKFTPVITPALRVDANRICISGFAYGMDYATTILSGLPASDGDKTTVTEKLTISVRDKAATISFGGAGFILPRESGGGVPLETINVDAVKLKLFRVSERSIIENVRGKWLEKKNWSYEALQMQEKMQEIWAGEMVTKAPRNQRAITNFPLSQSIKDRKPGIYYLTAKNANDMTGTGQASDWESGCRRFEPGHSPQFFQPLT